MRRFLTIVRRVATSGLVFCAGSLTVQALLAPAQAATPAPAPAPAPVLEAIVTYETRQVLPSGIVRTESWKERLVRQADTVWTERIRPGHAHKSVGQGEIKRVAHKHFNYDTAARWLSRDPRGELVLRFVDTEHQLVVNVPKTEFSAVGFDGRWDAAAHIVPPSIAKSLPVRANSEGATAGAVWRGETKAGWSHRILWLESQQIALRVQSRRLDGSVSRTVSVEPVRASRTSPWLQSKSFEQKSFEDFLD